MRVVDVLNMEVEAGAAGLLPLQLAVLVEVLSLPLEEVE
jgi:hypothetical protein